jgi:hypothetical protein
MSLNGAVIAPIITAIAAVLTAIAMPFVIVFQYLTGRDLKKVKEHTDGMVGQIAKMAEEKGHAKGAAQATTAGEEKAATLAEGQAQGRAQAQEEK